MWWCIKLEFLSNEKFEEWKKLEWMHGWLRSGVNGWQGYDYLCCVMLSRPPLDAMANPMRSKSSSSLYWNRRWMYCVVVVWNCGCVGCFVVSMLKYWVWMCWVSIWTRMWSIFVRIGLKKGTIVYYYFEFIPTGRQEPLRDVPLRDVPLRDVPLRDVPLFRCNV